jgi:3-isopropylmalate dehydratase small subunit
MLYVDMHLIHEVNLPAQQVSSGDFVAGFDIDPHVEQRLLNGWEQIHITLQSEADIAAGSPTRAPAGDRLGRR